VANSAPIVVREASVVDRDAIWPLTRDFATSFTPTRSAFNDSFELVLADTHMLLLVADAPRVGPVGYLLANRHATLFANGPVAWVEEVMVDPSVRGGGLGRRLVCRAEVWARAGGARYLALATRRAEGFYQALGYEGSAVFFRKLLDT
jgi:GNAT superfamily N-acetyltransferase